MTQHLYDDAAQALASRKPQKQRNRPPYVPDLGNIADRPICELPIAAIGPSPSLRLIDCPECLLRAIASTEERLSVLRERLAKLEAAS